MLFPFSLEGATRIWLEKEPPRSIITWDDLVSKFINKFFPPSKQQIFEMISRDFNNDLMKLFTRHGTDSMIFFGHSKSKVRNSRNKPVVAKVSSSSSTPGISPDVAELKDMVKALLLDKKNQTQAPAPVKAVRESCVTCGGTHSYQNCPSTDGNVYRNNIQEYVSQAAPANFNQGNTCYRAPIANQIRPPGFPPIQNQGNNQNRYNQNQGTNYNQGQIYRPPINQPPVHQAPPYQAPAPQTQGVTKTDFESYVKANDAVMRNMQDQNQNLQNQMTNLTDMLSKFVNSNTASTSSSVTLPSNTITNPKVDLQGITTRSGVAYQGPTMPTTSSSLPKVVERETEVTKDTVPHTNNGSTKNVQPPVVQIQPQAPNSEPVVAPVSALMPNQKSSIPYPLRRNDERRREKANNQIEKFYEIFKDLSFEISLTDALILMLKFASTLKDLIGNKEKLSEMARTLLNEHCSAVILNKLPEKLRDPGKFLIPCDFPGMDECLALADLGASINLMPLSVWKKLSLPKITPTCMTLKLADRSITQPIEVLSFSDVIASGNPTLYYDPIVSTSSPTLTPFGDSDFLLEEVDAFLSLEDDPTSSEVDDSYYDAEGGNDKLPVIISKDLSVEEKAALIKIIMEEDYKPAIQHQRRVNPKIHDVIKKEVEKLLDAELIYSISDSPWEKSHFMVKEGIVLGHKISKNGIEVDKDKVDVIAKLPHPTTVKGVQSFLGHAGFY
ncbi:reverse transcriptase domain-containing protein [Tanacetum coccineum]